MLFVCEGNVCRSPMAEYLARRRLGPRVSSAGTHGVIAEPMHPLALRVLAEVDVDGALFRSRPMSPWLLAESRLVLTATREQRAACVRMAPAILGRAFTLRQFGRLVRAVDPSLSRSGLDAVLEAVHEARGKLQPVPAAEEDIADPVRGTLAQMRECRERIEESLEAVLPVIENS